MASDYSSLKEAAAKLGVHSETLRIWLKHKRRNRPPARRIGPRKWGLPRKKFDQWMEGTT